MRQLLRGFLTKSSTGKASIQDITYVPTQCSHLKVARAAPMTNSLQQAAAAFCKDLYRATTQPPQLLAAAAYFSATSVAGASEAILPQE
jgi:hypothetical protein